MKTVITVSHNNLSALFDKRFGRAVWFCIYDEQSDEMEFYKNEYAQVKDDAGIQVVEKMKTLGIEKVISGDFGLNAKEELERSDIQMVILDGQGITLEKILQRLRYKV